MQKESTLLKRLCIISLIAHVVLITVDLSRYLVWNAEEVVPLDMIIPFELIDEFPATAQQKAPEVLVNEQILPQLPKNFKIAGEVAPEEDMDDPEHKLAAIKKELLQKKQEDDKNKIELTKKEALARLLKEKARKDKKFHNDAAALPQALKDRQAQLEAFLEKNASGMQLGYTDIIRSWIKKNYQLPDAYNLKSENLEAVFKLVIDKNGQISELNLTKSSNNQMFDQLALKTIQDSAPYPSPPNDWVGRVITVPISVKNM